AAFSDGFRSADVMVLGCTHYPLLKTVLHRVIPENVTLVDSAESVALAVWNFLNSGSSRVGPGQFGREGLPHKKQSGSAQLKFFVTDSAEKFRRLGTLFLGREIRDITHVDLKE